MPSIYTSAPRLQEAATIKSFFELDIRISTPRPTRDKGFFPVQQTALSDSCSSRVPVVKDIERGLK